jgi:unsaturated rhamnogalacturonyl hydrolase
MQKIYVLSFFLLLGLGVPGARSEVMTREQIISAADQMADTQFESMGWNFWARFWVDGVYWAGVMDLAKVSDNPNLQKAVRSMGTKKTKNLEPWALSYVDQVKEPNHADDFCISQAFLDEYALSGDSVVLEDTKRRADLATDAILSAEMAEKAARVQDLHWQEGLTWYWCDALFMAAPVHARLSAVTGDPKYLKAMHTEWRRASDLLYDPEEHLYFRDKKYITRQTKNGKKTFWSRGNGWVIGALARTLPYIPENDPLRPWYVNQFKEMAAKLASLQRPDGTWSPSLLDYEEFPNSETSGTALNTFAIAWGINNGILDDKTYRPVVEKAWSALLSARKPDGFLGYVQGVGSEPGPVYASQHVWYGNGAFLMAAAQLAQMAPINLTSSVELTAAADVPPWVKKKQEEARKAAEAAGAAKPSQP